MVQLALGPVEVKFDCVCDTVGTQSEAFKADSVGERRVPVVFEIFKSYVVVRPFGARDTRLYFGKVQL